MPAPTVGSVIGQYKLLEKIGSGGMATVYRAYHERLDREVAIKVMHDLFLADDSFLSRFEREARIVASLDHPNIIPMYDYDDQSGVPYLVMKYVKGETLKSRLTNNGVLSLDDILKIVPAIADALTYAHNRGVLHRDVKPSNIIIDEDGIPYLMDFGLARMAQAGESTMSADMMLGTPHYISPEQAQGVANLDARTDVYALGVLLYELLVGRVPFTGDTPFIIVHKHIYDDPELPSTLNPDLPPEIDNIILKALDKNRGARYKTPNELAGAFRAVVTNTAMKELDPERASIAERIRAERVESNLTPSRNVNPRVVSIPSPVGEISSNNLPVQYRQPTNLQELINDIVLRFIEAIQDILLVFQQGRFFETVRNRAPNVAVEIQSNVERVVREIQNANADGTQILTVDAKGLRTLGESERSLASDSAVGGELVQEGLISGEERRQNRAGRPDSRRTSRRELRRESRSQRRASTRLIERDWGDETRIARWQTAGRIAKQTGFFINFALFMVFMAFVIPFEPQMNQWIQEWFGPSSLNWIQHEVPFQEAWSTLLYQLPRYGWIPILQEIHILSLFAVSWAGSVVANGVGLLMRTRSRFERERDAIDRAMTMRYGNDWIETTTDREYKKIRQRVHGRFEMPVRIFQQVPGMLASWLAFTLFSPAIYGGARLFWGEGQFIPEPLNSLPHLSIIFGGLLLVVLLIQCIAAIALGIGMRALDFAAAQTPPPDTQPESDVLFTKAKNEEKAKDASVRLTGDGEFTESFVEELENQPSRKQQS